MVFTTNGNLQLRSLALLEKNLHLMKMLRLWKNGVVVEIYDVSETVPV